jgi:hypothetical protein
MDKSYIDKCNVIRKDINGYRPINIDYIFKYDALIMDNWVSKFYKGIKPEERIIKKNLDEKYAFHSNLNLIVEDYEYKKLESLSEALVSLINSPSWIDIIFVTKKLNIIYESGEFGSFDLQRNKCIDYLINYFDA